MTTLTTDAPLPHVRSWVAPPGIEHAPEPIATAAAEVKRLHKAHREAVAELRAVEADIPAAVDADRRALSAAVAAGKADPGTPAAAKLATAQAAARRKVEGLADAAADAYAALNRALADHSDEWRRQLDTDAADARSAALECIDALGSAVATVGALERLEVWLARVASDTTGSGRIPNVTGTEAMVNVRGLPLPAAELLALLAAWAAGDA